MRRVAFITLVGVVAVSIGYASVRLRAPQPTSSSARTIVYRLTSYDEAGKQTGVSTLVRQVLADGTWKHTQVDPDGSAHSMTGHLKGPLTSRTSEETLPTFLSFRYLEEKNRSTEAWISPELQDYLKLITLRDNGLELSRLEAVAISRP